jgi:hypothetical protein
MRASRRRTIAALITLGALVGAGCSKHHVTMSNPCPGATTKNVIVVSRRGAIALPKLGLTPGALKAEVKCG